MISMPADLRLANARDIQDITASSLFDATWYLACYPDVALLNMDPAEHYIWLGWRIGRHPSLAFDTNAYNANHPDVARTGVNPLLHYLRHGQREERQIFTVTEDELHGLAQNQTTPDAPAR